MMRSFEEIEKLIRDAGAPPRSPMAQMIAGTAQKLNTASLEIAGKILIIRDALDRAEQKLGQADPHVNTAGELQRTPAELDLLLARFQLLSDQLGMLVKAASEAKALPTCQGSLR
jgi:hypothetical protein